MDAEDLIRRNMDTKKRELKKDKRKIETRVIET